MKKVVESKKVPRAIGPYNQAIVCDKMVFISGQLPVNIKTGIPTSIKEQTKQVLENLGHILAEVGLSYDHVVKTTCFLADMGDFAAMNEVYSTFFQETARARATIAVKELPLKALVEIECIAIIS